MQDAVRLTGIKRRVMANGVPEREEVRVRTAEGTRWYDLTVQPQCWSGRTTGVLCAAVDILKLQGFTDPNAQTAYDILDHQSPLLVRLVDDLLDVNRIRLTVERNATGVAV